MTKRILILLIFLFGATNAYSQWEWVHPKPTGQTYRWCKMWDSETFYIAGTFGTFIKTTNGGNNWFINLKAGVSSSIDGRYGDIRSGYFFNSNSGIIVGQNGGRKTTNAGVTFEDIPTLSVPGDIYDICFINNSTGFAAGNGGFLSKTIDGGNTWNQIMSIPSQDYYSVCSPNEGKIFVGSFSGNILMSINSGINWTTVNASSSSNINDIGFINEDTIIAVGSSNTFSISTNGGINWISRTPPTPATWYDLKIKNISGVNNILISGVHQYHILKSTNLGVTWDSIKIYTEDQKPVPKAVNSFDCLLTGDTILSVGSYGLANIRMNSSNINSLTDYVKMAGFSNNGISVIGSNIWVAGSPQIRGVTFDQILFSSDRGVSWISQSPGNIRVPLYDIKMVDQNTGYAVGDSGVVIKTSNGGVSWNTAAITSNLHLRSASFIDSHTGWILGQFDALYKTTDGGSTYIHQLSDAYNSWDPVYRCEIEMVNSSTGWLVGNNSNNKAIVCKTNNGGINWVTQYTNNNSACANSIKMIDENTGYVCGSKSLIRKTINGGISWDSIASPIANTEYLSIDFQDHLNGVVTAFTVSIHTSDGGLSWYIRDGIFPGNNSQVKMVSNDTAFLAGNYCGVMKLTDFITNNTTHWINEIPQRADLEQNYPNPFNPLTMIEFAVPKQGRISLKIYDITGREVSTLIDNLELNPGIFKQMFNGNDLASGIYFYSLIIEDIVIQTKKMVLLK